MLYFCAEQAVKPQEWNEDAIRLNGCAFHSHEWSRFTARNNAASPLYLRLCDESGKTQALAIALCVTEKVLGYAICRSLALGSLPAVVDPSLTWEFIKQVIQYASDQSFLSIHIHSFGTPKTSDALNSFDFLTERRWEFLLDLTPGETEVWNNIHSKKRNLIRKGQKAELIVRKSHDPDDLIHFRRLTGETSERKRGQGTSFPREGNESYYRLLKSELIDTGIGRLYLAWEGDQPIAGAFFVGFNGCAYYMLSAASQRGLRNAAPDLLLWKSIRDYMAEGYGLFNFGGLSEKELNGQQLEASGLYHFKKRFSGQVYPCFKGRLILRPYTEAVLDHVRHTWQFLRRCFVQRR